MSLSALSRDFPEGPKHFLAPSKNVSDGHMYDLAQSVNGLTTLTAEVYHTETETETLTMMGVGR